MMMWWVLKKISSEYINLIRHMYNGVVIRMQRIREV